ncbi:MAG: fccA [Betaproteobacteria bacterium]|nr:fccA [Betaproteobacteria bacterium]
MRLFVTGLALCVGAHAALAQAQAQDANLARNLAAACFSCHGTDGHAQSGMASLAGRPQAEIMRIIGEFRSGARSGEQGTLMPQLVKGYTDAQMALIADYFSRQKPVQGAP